MAQRQENFFGPVIEALVARQRILEGKQAQQQRQQEIELRKKALEQQAKRDEAYLKQAEASDKIKRLQQGQELFALKEAQIDAVTGTPEKSAKRNIPGAGVVTENPILQNILQQRGIKPQDTGIMVRGQENAPVNLDIPDLTGEGVQASIPLGTTQELLAQRLANQATRRQEEERQLQLVGQSENLKSRARAAGAFPFQLELAQQKNRQALDLEQSRQENRKEIAELRGNFQLEAAKQRAANKTVANVSDLSNIAYEIGVGLQTPSGGFEDKAAVTNILHSQGWVTPPKNLDAVITNLSQAPILLGQVDSIIDKLGKSNFPAINQFGRALINPVFPQEVIKQRETLSAQLAPIMRNIFQEKGNLANRDIERGESLFPDLSANPEDNVRRRELLNLLFEASINNSMRALPETQKKAIFDQHEIPYRVLTPEQIDKRYAQIDKYISSGGKQTESTPSTKIVKVKGQNYPVGETVTVQTTNGPITGKFTAEGKFIAEE